MDETSMQLWEIIYKTFDLGINIAHILWLSLIMYVSSDAFSVLHFVMSC